MPSTLRILHISDLHATPETPAWSSNLVLSDNWKHNLHELLKEDGPFDLVCFTGDVAYSGKAEDYAQAHKLLTGLLEPLQLPSERLFVVPGNHDIDRSLGKPAWEALRNMDEAGLETLNGLMARKSLPPGPAHEQRELLLSRQSAYRDWVAKTLNRPDMLPQNSPHGTLGYRKTLHLDTLPFDVHVIGLDSGWAAGDNHDKGNLLLTANQAGILTTDSDGAPLKGFRLALIHHPLSDLADRDRAKVSRRLDANVDLLLRGHLHETEITTVQQPGRTSVQFAAGCLYEHESYRNAFHTITVHLDDQGRPLRYALRFRNWEPHAEYWRDNGGVYKEARDGRLVWPPEPEQVKDKRPPPIVFIGREEELERIGKAVRPADGTAPRPVSIQGMPGVGKTVLAEKFFDRNQARFPGGLLRVVLDPQAPADTDLLLQQLAERRELSISSQDLAERVQAALRQARILLLIENVDSEDTAKQIVPLVRKLTGCPVLLTGRLMKLGADGGWESIKVPLFDELQALEQLAQEWKNDEPQELPPLSERKLLARELGYLPLALHLAASYLRVGSLDVQGFLKKLHDEKLKLPPSDPADRLFDGTHKDLRAVLESTFALSHELLRRQLGAASARMLPGFEALGHAPPSGFGVSLGAAVAGLSDQELLQLIQEAIRLSLISVVPRDGEEKRAWRIHPLLAEFLRNQAGSTEGFTRLSEWFLARLPELEPGEEQGQCWTEVHQEADALVDWLARVPNKDLIQVERASRDYALRNGPYAAWVALCERALNQPISDSARSSVLWTLGQTARQGGALNRALSAAEAMLTLDQSLHNERGAALASGLRADILHDRGQLDEALRIRREEVLPVLEKLGDVRSRALTLGKIADILQDRGQLDEALRIHREDQLPVFEKLGDVRERAITLGNIADILQARGQFDEALRIRREEVLPVFEKLGDVRSRAITLGKIADILQARDQLDEALRIRREEELPVYEKLGDVHSRAITLGKIADILDAHGQLDKALRILSDELLPVFEKLGDVRSLLVERTNLALLYGKRNQEGDRQQAIDLLHLALEKATELRIPEAEQIRGILKKIE